MSLSSNAFEDFNDFGWIKIWLDFLRENTTPNCNWQHWDHNVDTQKLKTDIVTRTIFKWPLFTL